jgi:hypothetical protein
MAAIALDARAREQSTFIITVAITDEDDTAVIPATLTWTLTDANGKVINSRADVEVSTPAEENVIVLKGADLQILGTGDSELRVFTIEGTYNSNNGSGLPIKDRATFYVDNLVAV